MPSCEADDLWTDAERTARAVFTYGLDRVAAHSPLVVDCTPLDCNVVALLGFEKRRKRYGKIAVLEVGEKVQAEDQ